MLLEHWDDLEGYGAAHGLPELDELSLSRTCSYIWWFFTRDASLEDRQKFKAQLWKPPVNTAPDPRSPWSAEKEAQAFQSLKAALGQ